MSNDTTPSKPDGSKDAPDREVDDPVADNNRTESTEENPYKFEDTEPVFEDPKTIDDTVEAPNETTEPAPPQQAPPVTAPDEAALALAAAEKRKRRQRYARVIRSYFTIAVIAGLAIATLAYKDKISQLTGKQICAYNALGPYATPPADILKNRPSKDAQYVADLNAARKLFWAGDKAAIAAYEALIAKFTDRPEAIGELGNVYFKHGQNDKAAKAWYDAGNGFLKQNRTKRAAQLVDVLKQLDPALAAKLQHNLAKALK